MSGNFVYIIECKDGSFYTGWTTDVGRRLAEHNSGIGSKYTRSRYPVKLRFMEEFTSKEEALKREFAIKKLSREKKIELIENSNLEISLK
ncbi:MAG TPA: GIY-YIG nuclease family protein [Clostridiaceae bacterium]|nr:GIY-YIG nuclease family protein [Clostridiaceae bacterium]